MALVQTGWFGTSSFSFSSPKGCHTLLGALHPPHQPSELPPPPFLRNFCWGLQPREWLGRILVEELSHSRTPPSDLTEVKFA
ncbi:hypothetical protein NPIL_221351 [Nephila pilipes]|uniref:Uncharacterized protein n=1 Tax=Nephila pilipes TaxID=299642 RepID=A0A8X6QUI9_NEPPI|nr:hypothetical protein NPIL_221351 [Nephila pilipes]